jgi:hypothetical protein
MFCNEYTFSTSLTVLKIINFIYRIMNERRGGLSRICIILIRIKKSNVYVLFLRSNQGT